MAVHTGRKDLWLPECLSGVPQKSLVTSTLHGDEGRRSALDTIALLQNVHVTTTI